MKERYDCEDHSGSEDEEGGEVDGKDAPDSSPRAGPLVANR